MAVERPTTTPTTETPPPIVIPDAAGDDRLLREFGMEEHPRGGFHGLLEVIPTRADYILDLIRANSLWPLLSGLSCCAIEMMSTATSVNDIDRFGMFPFRASPRQADVLIVAGTLTTKMAGRSFASGSRCRSRSGSSRWAPAPPRAADSSAATAWSRAWTA